MRTAFPDTGLHSAKQIPGEAHRRNLMRKPHKVRICRDDRVYVSVPFTISGVVQAINYGPMWRVDRDYWVARVTANIGRHDDATHPNDGTPSGQSMRINLQRVKADLSSDVGLMNSDGRLNIGINHHQDAVNDAEEGIVQSGDFAIHRLFMGEHLYPRVIRVGSGRPGTGLVVTAVLVPIP